MAKEKPAKITSKKHLARLERERRQTRLITWISIGIIVLVVGFIGYGILYQTVLKNLQPVVTVNGESVNLKEYQMRVRVTRQQYIDQYMQIYDQYQQYYQFAQMLGIDITTDPSLSQTFSNMETQLNQIQSQLDDSTTIGQQVLEGITNELIIRQVASANGITVTKEEVDDAIRETYGYFPEGTPTPSPTQLPFDYPTLSSTQLALVTPTIAVTAGPSATPENTPTLVPTETLPPTPTLDLTAIASITLEPSQTPTNTAVPSSTSTPTQVPTITSTATITAIPSITPTATPYTAELFQSNYQSALDYYAKLGMNESEFRKLFFESKLLQQRVSDLVITDVGTTREEVWARHILVADELTARVVLAELNAGADFATLAATFSTDTGTKNIGGDLGWFARNAMVAEFETAAFSLEIGEISEPVKSSYGWHIIQVLGHENRPLSEADRQTAITSAFNNWLTGQRTAATITITDAWTTNTPVLPDLESAFTELYATATAFAEQALQESTPTGSTTPVP